MKGQFEKYVNLIRNVSWNISKKYSVEYEEVEAQGFLIYCMILDSYDVSKAGFSTYLYIQLCGRLKDFACGVKDVEVKENGKLFALEENEQDPFLLTYESRNYDLNNDEIIERAKKNLDADSFNVFSYIISFEWLKENRRKPTVSDIMRKFNIKRDCAVILWNNCKNFWLNVA